MTVKIIYKGEGIIDFLGDRHKGLTVANAKGVRIVNDILIIDIKNHENFNENLNDIESIEIK